MSGAMEEERCRSNGETHCNKECPFTGKLVCKTYGKRGEVFYEKRFPQENFLVMKNVFPSMRSVLCKKFSVRGFSCYRKHFP